MKSNSPYLLNYEELLTRNRRQDVTLAKAGDEDMEEIYKNGFPRGEECGIASLNSVSKKTALFL